MPIRICVAGATGWTGSAIVKEVVASEEFELAGAVARRQAGVDIGAAIGIPPVGMPITGSLDEALKMPTDVLIDYTRPDAVKVHAMEALRRGVRVVIGTSGLTAEDFAEIDQMARAANVGVIAAGNFSITAALAKHFALFAARYLPSWEIIDYADARKSDAPSGTVRELAEELGRIAKPSLEVPIEETYGARDARGTSIGGAQVHSIRLPSFVISFETIFGMPDERLTIRHDAGSGAGPYVAGTLLAARKVMGVQGLVRGLDRLLF